MVDFNSEGAFTSNKGHILELLILGRRDELINTFQAWKKESLLKTAKARTYKGDLHSIIFALFLELKEALKRNDKDNFEKLESDILGENLDDKDLIKCFYIINQSLDKLNLIKIDNKKSYDSRLVEEENESKGL